MFPEAAVGLQRRVSRGWGFDFSMDTEVDPLQQERKLRPSQTCISCLVTKYHEANGLKPDPLPQSSEHEESKVRAKV